MLENSEQGKRREGVRKRKEGESKKISEIQITILMDLFNRFCKYEGRFYIILKKIKILKGGQ